LTTEYTSLAESSAEGYGSKRAVLPMVMEMVVVIMMMIMMMMKMMKRAFYNR
jgi:hypothetical protein